MYPYNAPLFPGFTWEICSQQKVFSDFKTVALIYCTYQNYTMQNDTILSPILSNFPLIRVNFRPLKTPPFGEVTHFGSAAG